MQVNVNTANGVMEELQRQRNQALNDMAQYAGQIRGLMAELAAAQKRIKELEAEAEKASQPQAVEPGRAEAA